MLPRDVRANLATSLCTILKDIRPRKAGDETVTRGRRLEGVGFTADRACESCDDGVPLASDPHPLLTGAATVCFVCGLVVKSHNHTVLLID